MSTQSPERLISLLLKLPDSHSLIPRGGHQPASIPGCPAEGKDGVVVAAPAGERYLGLDLAGVLHMHTAVLIGQPKQVLGARHRAEVQGVGGRLRVHLGTGKVRCYGGIVIIDSADKGGNKSSVGESSGQELETTKLPGCKIAQHTGSCSSSMGTHHLKVEQNSHLIAIAVELERENVTAVVREWR